MPNLAATFWISQAIVGLSFCIDLLSFQLRARKSILLCFAASSFLVGMHFLLLTRTAAGCLMFVSTLRYLVSYRSTSKLWMYTFTAIATGVLLCTYSAPVNLLIYAASVLATFSAFQKSDRAVRLAMMVASLVLLLHNFIVQSPAAVALEGFFLTSNLVGYYRYYGTRKTCC